MKAAKLVTQPSQSLLIELYTLLELMSSAALARNTEERRERYRAFMRAFNPTAPPSEAIKAGLVLEDLHQGLHRNLAARADLEPGGQQLIVGGIGSGKTTELLLASSLLGTSGKTLPLYIDVSAETDLSQLNSGTLLASFGFRLASHVLQRKLDALFSKSEIANLRSQFEVIRTFAYGKTEYRFVAYGEDPDEPDEDFVDRDDELDGYYVRHTVEGKLKKPFPALQREIEGIRPPLLAFIAALKKFDLEAVAVFDGLDRLIQPDKFWAVVHQDLRFLRKLSVSVLATGPISVLYGVGRSIVEYFDKVHHLAVITTEPKNLTFLHSVLQKRGSQALLDSDLAGYLCHASGGVLRDLITLVRDAAEEAYISGHEKIQNEDAKKVALQLGTAYRRGLGPIQVDILSRLVSHRVFDPSSAIGVEMLVTRRVLEYSATDFRVHPALVPLLQEPIE